MNCGIKDLRIGFLLVIKQYFRVVGFMAKKFVLIFCVNFWFAIKLFMLHKLFFSSDYVENTSISVY